MTFVSSAQKVSVSVNALNLVSFGTLNISGSYAMDRHWTSELEWVWNPWTYNVGDSQFQNRNLTGSLGARYWPWHVYSGWWIKGNLQYQIYNRGGVYSDLSEEGDAGGVGTGFGYALMLTPWLNLDFGVGLWGGTKNYVVYECTRCGRIVESGSKWFVAPDNFMLTFSFIF